MRPVKSAVQIYCEAVMEDFPETKIWMENIIKLDLARKESK